MLSLKLMVIKLECWLLWAARDDRNVGHKLNLFALEIVMGKVAVTNSGNDFM